MKLLMALTTIGGVIPFWALVLYGLETNAWAVAKKALPTAEACDDEMMFVP